jgi:hypothetical protein
VERVVRLGHGPGRPWLALRHAPRDSALARELARGAAAYDPGIFDEPADGPPARADTIRLLLAPDEASFRAAAGPRLPDWGLAVAFPAGRTIVMRPPRLVPHGGSDPGRVLAHELVHVYLALSLGEAEPAAPRWLHEGLASLLTGEWGWAERFDLALALAAGPPGGLERLDAGFPAPAGAAGLAYLESLSAVAHLRGLSGDEGLRVLLRNLRAAGDFDAALRRTYGLTYAELDARWREGLRRRYGWAALAASSWTWWTPAAFVLVLAAFLRRRRQRARLARMRDEDRDDSDARDHGAPRDGAEPRARGPGAPRDAEPRERGPGAGPDAPREPAGEGGRDYIEEREG